MATKWQQNHILAVWKGLTINDIAKSCPAVGGRIHACLVADILVLVSTETLLQQVNRLSPRKTSSPPTVSTTTAHVYPDYTLQCPSQTHSQPYKLISSYTDSYCSPWRARSTSWPSSPSKTTNKPRLLSGRYQHTVDTGSMVTTIRVMVCWWQHPNGQYPVWGGPSVDLSATAIIVLLTWAILLPQ